MGNVLCQTHCLRGQVPFKELCPFEEEVKKKSYSFICIFVACHKIKLGKQNYFHEKKFNIMARFEKKKKNLLKNSEIKNKYLPFSICRIFTEFFPYIHKKILHNFKE